MAWNANKKRTVKKSITKGLFEYIKETNPNKVFKCYLCLPSTKATDVKEALRQGVIDENTKIIAIEHDYRYLSKMKAALTRLGFKAKSRVVIYDDLCKITTKRLLLACEQLGVDKIDLCYIDTCNCLIRDLQHWIKNLVNDACTIDAVITTNVLAARATWGLEQYRKKGKYLLSRGNKNKWASPIGHCLEDHTNKLTGFIVGYKEKDVSSPMVLCVNGWSFHSRNGEPYASVEAIHKAIVKAESYQNLGYA